MLTLFVSNVCCQLLPIYCLLPGLLSHCNPPAHRTAVVCVLPYVRFHDSARRPHAGALLPHHRADARRPPRRGADAEQPQDARALRRHVPAPHGRCPRLPVRLHPTFRPRPMLSLRTRVILTWISNSFPRPRAKRAAAISIVNMLANASSVYGAFVWPSKDAPRYIPGGTTVIAASVVACIFALLIRLSLARENRRLEKGSVAKDRVGPDFRYIL